jgi:hypothetical protein
LVAFDADYRTNENVHNAIRKHVEFLEGCGSRVLVVDVPEVGGDPNTGLDDWIAVNGHPAILQRAARPIEPVDVRAERLSRDERLRLMAVDLWNKMEALPMVKRGECTMRSTARELIKNAENRGKVRADGIEVEASLRTLALAACTSIQGQSDALNRLEVAGFLRRVEGPRKKDKAQAYILLSDALKGRALGRHVGKEEAPKGRERTEQDGVYSLSQADSYLRVNLARALQDEVPELRWPTILRRQEPDEHGRPVEVYEYLARLGKKRGEIVRFLLELGGVTTVPELLERFGTEAQKKRPRDFRRRNLDMLAEVPAVVLIEGDVVSLTPRWHEALEHAREIACEEEAARLQAEKIARQRKAYRQRHQHKPEPVPEVPQVDDLREPWSRHTDGCACRECSKRFGRVVGEHPKGCKCGKCRQAHRAAVEDRGGRRRVVSLPTRRGPSRASEAVVADVVELHPESNPDAVWGLEEASHNAPEPPPNLPKEVNGVLVHGERCDCDWCEDEAIPTYARPVGGRV